MSDDKKRPTANLLHVSPQHWGEVERFTQFWATNYNAIHFVMNIEKVMSSK
jgi:hypothetical protein